MTTLENSQKRLNPRHHKLPIELQQAVLNCELPVTYDFYLKFKDVYSSKKLKVKFNCVECGTAHLTDFKHLNKRKVVKKAICPKCVMFEVGRSEEWKKTNSEAQLKVQNLPEVKAKNAKGVSNFWKNNPDKLEKMKANLVAAHKREDVIAKMKNRVTWNGRGISGDYLSKWGWLTFDSSYELATLVSLESKEGVLEVTRGPIIEYEFEGLRHYHIDYAVTYIDGKKTWMEVKSGYIGNQRDKKEKLRAKFSKALSLIRQGHADKLVLITEKSAPRILGIKMPRHDRAALLKNNAHKIIFAREQDEQKYGGNYKADFKEGISL